MAKAPTLQPDFPDGWLGSVSWVACDVGKGWMRSFDVKKVIRNKTKHSTAQTVMVICQPYC